MTLKSKMLAGRALRGPAMGLAFCVLFANAAEAANYKKSEREVKGIQQTDLTKPKAPEGNKKDTGPVLTIDEFVEQKRSEIMKIVDKQIEQMQRLINVTDDSDPQKADFYFRLAELYAEKHRYYTFYARGLDQKIFDAKGGDKRDLQSKQKEAEKRAEAYLKEAVKSYMGARNFKKYARMDEVLFKLAYLLQTVKREDLAREVFHELIKDYPNSKYIPDAYLSFAEFYFQAGEMDAARKFYERVEQFPDSSVYGYAVYKKGWCYVNLGDFKKALEIFVGVIRLTEQGKGGNKGQREALQREARKDVVKAYARVGGPDKAWEFFQRVGADFAPKMMEGLGELYWEQGMFGDSTKVYRRIISLNLSSERICEWQNKILRNTLSEGKKSDQVQELQRLGEAYELVSKKKNVKKGVMEECKNAFHDTTKELALVWHKEAQKTKNTDTYELVRFVYNEYLKYFENEPTAGDMMFYYGEVLWMTERWKEAAEQYTKFVERNPKHKDAKDAAYAAVLAWQNALNITDTRPQQKEGDRKFEKIELPAAQKKMIEAYDTYIKYVPDSPDLVKIKYRKARVYYEYNHFEEAARYFGEVVDSHAEDELAVYSANLLLDSLNILGRTEELVKWVDRFVQNPKLMEDEEFRKQMVSLKTDALVKEAKDFETANKFKECGISMVAAAESMPDHPKHDERLYNAGLCFQNARLIGQAIRYRRELIEKHPDSPLAQKALFQVAAGYHQIASYTKASEYYEQFATKFPGEDRSPVALGNATMFRIGLGENERAKDNMSAFIKFYGGRKPQDAADVFFQMGEIYEKQGDDEGLIRHLEAYLKTWGRKGGIDKEILAHFKLGELLWKRACPVKDDNGACIEVKRVEASGRELAFDKIKRQQKGKKRLRIPKQTQCGPATRSKVIVHERKANFAKDAQKHFDTVLKLFNRGKALDRVPGEGAEKQARAGLATSAAAGAAFYQAEALYEEFLQVKFPENLDFQGPQSYYNKSRNDRLKKTLEDSQKRFKKYLDEKGKLTLKLVGEPNRSEGLYERVFEFKVAHWTIAAAARVGQVWQNFADQLYTAEIPKNLKEVDEYGNRPREIYCDALVDQAEPVEAKAVTGFQVCLTGATRESWFNDWSRLCEVELNQMQPSEYPLASEAKPEAGYTPTVITAAPVVTELPEAKKSVALSSGSE
ncbi:MAG: tetratricopeptide repeat protein [Myxococcales bacterium]|nr:tetratricopeptide repeat protein [Myxococcales bacterium]